MKIGNIVTKEPITVEKIFNVVDSIDDCIDGIPTLIIGHYIVKELSDNLNFITRKLDDNTQWTFTYKEQRKYHIIDVDIFKDLCLEKVIEKIHYIYVDPIQFKRSKIKKIISKINTLEGAISYIHKNNIAYIYSENIIFGIDLKLLKFIGVDVDKIKSRIRTLSTVTLEQSEILIEYKNYMERLDEQVKYIPLLYSINNDE